MHVAGVLGFVLASASVLLQNDWLFGFAGAFLGLVALGAMYGKRRWLSGYIETSASAVGRWFAGNLPALRAFDRALVHAGAFTGADGRTWVRASRAVVYGCFVIWAALMVLQAVRGV